MKTFDLYEIVKQLNGGGVAPIGESNYDEKAFKRMQEQKNLVRLLIDDIERVAILEGYEASVCEAKTDAIDWLLNLKEDIEGVLLEVKHDSN